MAAEHDVGPPLLELLKQEESLFAGKCGGKLQSRWTENVGVAEHKCVAVMDIAVEHTLLDKVDLRLAQRATGCV